MKFSKVTDQIFPNSFLNNYSLQWLHQQRLIFVWHVEIKSKTYTPDHTHTYVCYCFLLVTHIATPFIERLFIQFYSNLACTLRCSRYSILTACQNNFGESWLTKTKLVLHFLYRSENFFAHVIHSILMETSIN